MSLFFFFAHLHTHINTTSVGTRIRTAGMCWKVWMLLVIGRSHKMTYLAVIWETARGRKRRREGGKKRNEGDLTVCVCVWERDEFQNRSKTGDLLNNLVIWRLGCISLCVVVTLVLLLSLFPSDVFFFLLSDWFAVNKYHFLLSV